MVFCRRIRPVLLRTFLSSQFPVSTSIFRNFPAVLEDLDSHKAGVYAVYLCLVLQRGAHIYGAVRRTVLVFRSLQPTNTQAHCLPKQDPIDRCTVLSGSVGALGSCVEQV